MKGLLSLQRRGRKRRIRINKLKHVKNRLSPRLCFYIILPLCVWRGHRDCVKTEARSLTCKLPFDDPPGPLGTKLSAGQLWRLKVEDEFLSSYDIEHSFDIVCEIDQRDFTGNILEAA